eukprot:SAG22_NODE_157_length_16986_cov_17.230177_6_plen_991_part_00
MVVAEKLGEKADAHIEDLELHVESSGSNQITVFAKVTVPSLGRMTLIYTARNGDGFTNTTENSTETDWVFFFHTDIDDVGAMVQKWTPDTLDLKVGSVLGGASGDIMFKWCAAPGGDCSQMLAPALARMLTPEAFRFRNRVINLGDYPNGLTLSARDVAIPRSCDGQHFGDDGDLSDVPCKLLSSFVTSGADQFDFNLQLGLFGEDLELKAVLVPKPALVVGPTTKSGYNIAGVTIDRVEVKIGKSKTFLKGQCGCRNGRVKIHEKSVSNRWSVVDPNLWDTEGTEAEYYEAGCFDFKTLCEYDPELIRNPFFVKDTRRLAAEAEAAAEEEEEEEKSLLDQFDSCPYAKDGVCDEDPNTELLDPMFWAYCPDCVAALNDPAKAKTLKNLAETINCEYYNCGAQPYNEDLDLPAGSGKSILYTKPVLSESKSTGEDFDATHSSRKTDAFGVHCFWGTDTTDCDDRGPGPVSVTPGWSAEEDCDGRACDKSDRAFTCWKHGNENDCHAQTTKFMRWKGPTATEEEDHPCTWEDRPAIMIETTIWGNLHVLNQSLTFPKAGLRVELAESASRLGRPQMDFEIVTNDEYNWRASCTGDEDADGNKCALNGDRSACAATSGGENCVFRASDPFRLQSSKEWVTGFVIPTLQLKDVTISGTMTTEPPRGDFQLQSGWCIGSEAHCKAGNTALIVTGSASIAFGGDNNGNNFRGTFQSNPTTVSGLSSALFGKFAEKPLALLKKVGGEGMDLSASVLPGVKLELAVTSKPGSGFNTNTTTRTRPSNDLALYAQAGVGLPGLGFTGVAFAMVTNLTNPDEKTYALALEVGDIAKMGDAMLGTTWFSQSFLSDMGGSIAWKYATCTQIDDDSSAQIADANVECPDQLHKLTMVEPSMRSAWTSMKSGFIAITAHTAVPDCVFEAAFDTSFSQGVGSLTCQPTTLSALMGQLFKSREGSADFLDAFPKIDGHGIGDTAIPGLSLDVTAKSDIAWIVGESR